MTMIGGSEDKSEPMDEEESEKFDSAAGRKEASKALIRAIKNGDWEAVDSALEAHYEACEAGK